MFEKYFKANRVILTYRIIDYIINNLDYKMEKIKEFNQTTKGNISLWFDSLSREEREVYSKFVDEILEDNKQRLLKSKSNIASIFLRNIQTNIDAMNK